MNLFVKYNTVLRKTEILGRLEGEAIIEQTLISDIFYNNGHLFLIPCRAKYFYLYDMINNSFTKLGNECTVLEEESFYTSISVNGKLYCMPFKSDYMEVIDCFTQKTKRINMKLIMDHDFEFVNDTCLISDDKIAFVTIDSFINIFDTNTNTITSCYCGDKESEFIRIISYNNDIFVLDQRKRTVYKWIIQTNELQPLINENEFFVMSRNGNDIIIDFQNKYKKYSLSTKTLGNEIMRCQSDYFCSLSSEYSNSICSNESNLSIMFDRYEEILYVKIGSEETKHYVEIDKKSLVESIDCKSQVESEIYGINEFVKICCNNIEHIKGNNVLFGGTIYKYIKDKMNQ